MISEIELNDVPMAQNHTRYDFEEIKDKKFVKINEFLKIKTSLLINSQRYEMNESENYLQLCEIANKEHTLMFLENTANFSRIFVLKKMEKLVAEIAKWTEIFNVEPKRIPASTKAEIIAFIGSGHLLNDRLKKALAVFDAAQEFINNGGLIIANQGKQFRAENIFDLMNPLIADLDEIDLASSRLTDLRKKKWAEPNIRAYRDLSNTQIRKLSSDSGKSAKKPKN